MDFPKYIWRFRGYNVNNYYMCCLVAILAVFGPRAAVVIWWLFDMGRWTRAFDTVVWPILGFMFLPWTTLAYVLVFSNGITGPDWLALILGFLLDLGSYRGGYEKRHRLRD